jgi:acyl-CoA synthetase (AMP-forming)/AMP-acid ligase II
VSDRISPYTARDWSDDGLIRWAPDRAPPDGPWTCGEIIEVARRAWPDREALVGRHRRLSYAELADEIDAATCALQAMGVRAGDRVAATAANHPDIVVAFFAAQRLGAIWVGVNRVLAAPEKRYILKDSGASFYLAEGAAAAQVAALRESLPDLRGVVEMEPGERDGAWAHLLAEHRGRTPAPGPTDPHAPAAIAYTSGTTGFPKGVVHSQYNMIMVGAVARLTGSASDIARGGVALPLTILNLMILGPVSAFQVGRACILMDRIDAVGLADWIARERVEHFSGPPATIYDLLTHPDVRPGDLASLKAPGAGGAAIPHAFRELYRRKFGTELQHGYGLTEAPTIVTSNVPASAGLPGCSGRPSPHLRIAIKSPDGDILPPGDSGEICVAAADSGAFAGLYTPMLGYWRKPEATAQALRSGWLHTGDIGRVDEDGNLFVEGRRNDVVIRGGANVYPAEIERVLQTDGRVADCAVTGRPDERLGERVVAFVQPSTDVAEIEALRADLLALCAENLAKYKIPGEIIFVAEMPRNAMNKIVKAELKARYFTSGV